VTAVLTVDVVGTPAPQGSKRAFQHRTTGRVVVVESNNAKNKSWRQDVKAAALNVIAEHATEPFTGPLAVTIAFRLPRPGYHYGTGRNANTLKPGAPDYVEKKPDLDKLVRSTLDALGEAGVWRDDAQVAGLQLVKQYATHEPPGAHIEISSLNSVPAAGSSPVPSAGTVQEALL